MKDDKVRIGIEMTAAIVWEFLMGFIAYWFMWDSVLYMLPRTMKAYFEEEGSSKNSGVSYDY